MKPWRIIRCVVLWASAFSAGCSGQSGAEAKKEPSKNSVADPAAVSTAPVPAFKPDPELAAQLGEPVQVADYEISAPTHYNLVQPSAPAGVTVNAWGGERRGDGSAPMIQLLIAVLPPDESVPELGIVLEKMLAGVQRRRTNWVRSETTYGSLGGIKFARVEWTGTESTLGREMVGVMYVGLDQKTIIQLHTQDVPNEKEALKLGEAALLTFTKK